MTPGSSEHVANSDGSHAAPRTSLWVSVDSEARGSTAAIGGDRSKHDRRRTAAQCVIVASLASFVIGVFMTTAGFGPLLSSPRRRQAVIIVVLQARDFYLLLTC